ncbi:branched-chain amino acid ABC transporter permease [Paraburkholderia sp. MM5477-R1]|uniref:branched-chain amino acid ABC transporter permease n=1 Tax=Paraburkholderia sp. MM5477-R1 TaxID=2991062 RepID=UPI003D1FD24E
MSTMKGERRLIAAQTPQEPVPPASAERWNAYLPPRPKMGRQMTGWGAALGVAIVLPFIFPGTLGISVLTQIGIAVTFALAYNMLLGGTGLLSFGHALYFGTGAYATAHFLNYFGDAVPVVLLPLVGGLGAMLIGAVVALFTVRSGKIIFAMLSLAVGQLAYSAATIMTGWSGGDEGIRLDPSHAAGWGIDFGSPLAIYFLVAAWTWVAAVAMYALTRTPLGRLMNATRDNPERMDFVGFSPTMIRGLALTLSAGFAGMAGALYALGFQVVTLDTLGLPQSTAGMLHAYIGGHTAFFGPVVGAVLITVVSAHLSTLTDAWPLYLGVFFVAVIISMRHGLTGSLSDLWRRTAATYRKGGVAMVARQAAPNLLGGIAACAGFVAAVEMIRSLTENMGAPVSLPFASGFGFALDPHRPLHWIVSALFLAAGLAAITLKSRAVRT